MMFPRSTEIRIDKAVATLCGEVAEPGAAVIAGRCGSFSQQILDGIGHDAYDQHRENG